MIKTLIKKDLIVKFGALLHPVRAYNDLKQRKKLFATALSAFIFIFYAFIIQSIMFGNLDQIVNNRMEKLIIISITSAHTMFTLFIVIPSIMSTFYFSNDIKIMQTLPIKNREIIISKFISIFFDSLLISLFLIIPTFIRLCYYGNYSIMHYLFVLCGIFFTNILVITIMSAIIIFLMRYLNRISNLKNKIQAFTLVASIVIWVIFTHYSNSSNDMLNIIKSFDNTVWSYIPHTFFLTKIFNNNVITSLLYTAIYGLLVFILMYLCARYMESALQKGIELNSITNVKSSKKNKKLAIKHRSVSKEIAVKEFKEILRTPIYFFNIMSVGVIFIIIFAFGFFKAASEDGVNIFKQFSLAYSFGDNIFYEILISMVAGFLFTTTTCMNSSTLSTFTREGKFINFIKTLPTTAKEQVDGRLLASFWIAGLNVLFIIIASIVAVILLSGFNLSIIYIPLCIAFGAFISWLYYANADLYMGIKSPFFDWDTPQRAVKGGANGLKSILFTLSNAAVIYLVFKILSLFLEDLFNIMIFTAIVYMIFTLIAGFIFYKINIKTLNKELPKYNAE